MDKPQTVEEELVVQDSRPIQETVQLEEKVGEPAVSARQFTSTEALRDFLCRQGGSSADQQQNLTYQNGEHQDQDPIQATSARVEKSSADDYNNSPYSVENQLEKARVIVQLQKGKGL